MKFSIENIGRVKQAELNMDGRHTLYTSLSEEKDEKRRKDNLRFYEYLRHLLDAEPELLLQMVRQERITIRGGK